VSAAAATAAAFTRPSRPSWLARAGTIAGVWTAIALFRAVERWVADPLMRDRLEFGFQEALAQNLVACGIWAAMTPGIFLLARRHAIYRPGLPVTLLVHSLASIAAPALHTAAFRVLYPTLMGLPMEPGARLAALPSAIAPLFFTGFLTYWGVAAAAWALDADRLARDRSLAASQLQRQLAEARLEALKMQLHPHFLFNSLHSILPLVYRDRDEAAKTVGQLAELLRLSFASENEHLVPLSREMEFLRLYLDIQKTRFRERLQVVLSIDPAALSLEVPNLILQPLVENAVKHGIDPRPSPGRVEVSAWRDGGTLHLQVRDDGPGAIPRPEGSPAGGVGLRNTRARLQHLYPDRHRFAHGNARAGGFEVSIEIPATTAREASARSSVRPEAESL
jgi:signal transduction histidine kinase